MHPVSRACGAKQKASAYESGEGRFESCQARQYFSRRLNVGYLRLISLFWQLRRSYGTPSNFTLEVSHFGKTIGSRSFHVFETSPRPIFSNQFTEKVRRMEGSKKTQPLSRTCGATENACDYESRDCRLESCQARQYFSRRLTVSYRQFISLFGNSEGHMVLQVTSR